MRQGCSAVLAVVASYRDWAESGEVDYHRVSRSVVDCRQPAVVDSASASFSADSQVLLRLLGLLDSAVLTLLVDAVQASSYHLGQDSFAAVAVASDLGQPASPASSPVES